MYHLYPRLRSLTFSQAYGGGPLSTENGNKLIASGVKLASAYGLTEAGPVAHIFEGIDSDPSDLGAKHIEDWQWQSFPVTTKPRFVPQGDGTYELQFLVRSIAHLSQMYINCVCLQTCETHQLSIENLPDVKGYATADLWVPHPVKKGLWKMSVSNNRILFYVSDTFLIASDAKTTLLFSAPVNTPLARMFSSAILTIILSTRREDSAYSPGASHRFSPSSRRRHYVRKGQASRWCLDRPGTSARSRPH